jgi:SAM-dependent methyltransferase
MGPATGIRARSPTRPVEDGAVPDPIFAEPRLAAVYDAFDGERADLDLYVGLVDELDARTVLDVGCGTGSLACRLAQLGIAVVGVDPAAASLDVARGKPGADRVRWVLGTAADAGAVGADLAVMTGNVAQVFLGDDDWRQVLVAIRAALRPGGWLAFETRDPARRAWERWTPTGTRRTLDVPAAGRVTAWTDLVSEDLPLVSFRHHWAFDADGAELTSDSTLRFRSQDEIRSSLADAGFEVADIRDAPDRPGLEWVFLASAPDREAPA